MDAYNRNRINKLRLKPENRNENAKSTNQNKNKAVENNAQSFLLQLYFSLDRIRYASIQFCNSVRHDCIIQYDKLTHNTILFCFDITAYYNIM